MLEACASASEWRMAVAGGGGACMSLYSMVWSLEESVYIEYAMLL